MTFHEGFSSVRYHAVAASAQLPAPSPPSDEKQKLDALVTALEKERGTRVLVYWTTDMARISEVAVMSIYDQMSAIGKTAKLDLFLRTNGGDTEVPWRIVSLAREFCDEFNVLIPHRAASAGTLLALGADEIVMTPLGVLGPIDPSRTHPLLPRREGAAEAEPISVQDMRHAMQFIREAAGTDKEMPYTPDAMAQIFTALFDKIHPLAIGAIEQRRLERLPRSERATEWIGRRLGDRRTVAAVLAAAAERRQEVAFELLRLESDFLDWMHATVATNWRWPRGESLQTPPSIDEFNQRLQCTREAPKVREEQPHGSALPAAGAAARPPATDWSQLASHLRSNQRQSAVPADRTPQPKRGSLQTLRRQMCRTDSRQPAPI